MAITRLKKPCVRRIGDLVVRLDADGITVRGTREQKSWFLAWSRVLSLVDFTVEDMSILEGIEREQGKRVLQKLTAPSRPRKKGQPRKKV